MAFVVKPNEKIFVLIKEFFKHKSEKQKEDGRDYGVIEFTYKDLSDFHEDIPNTTSYISGIMNWLKAQGYIRQVRRGTAGRPSVWDVNNILNDTPDPTVQSEEKKEEKPKRRRKAKRPKIRVEVGKTEEKPEKQPGKNQEILNQIHQDIQNMIGFLRQLPGEMIGHLEKLSGQLQKVDDGTYDELREENEELRQEIDRLKKRIEYLMESANVTYNKHKIYRLRNMILDEFERVLVEPSWTLKKNSDYHRRFIQEKLDEIMDELGIFEEATTK